MQLGSGVSARVYEVHDKQTQKRVAVKCFRLWSHAKLQFEEEVKNLRVLKAADPNGHFVPTLYDTFTIAGKSDSARQYCYTMEFCEGKTLKQLLDESRVSSWRNGRAGVPLPLIRYVKGPFLSNWTSSVLSDPFAASLV